jgi:exoribonuclease R
MLLANTSVAKRIAVTFPEQTLLRRHASPIARRMEAFTELSQQLGYNIDGSSSHSLQESLASIKDPEIAHVSSLVTSHRVIINNTYVTVMCYLGALLFMR